MASEVIDRQFILVDIDDQPMSFKQAFWFNGTPEELKEFRDSIMEFLKSDFPNIAIRSDADPETIQSTVPRATIEKVAHEMDEVLAPYGY